MTLGRRRTERRTRRTPRSKESSRFSIGTEPFSGTGRLRGAVLAVGVGADGGRRNAPTATAASVALAAELRQRHPRSHGFAQVGCCCPDSRGAPRLDRETLGQPRQRPCGTHADAAGRGGTKARRHGRASRGCRVVARRPLAHSGAEALRLHLRLAAEMDLDEAFAWSKPNEPDLATSSWRRWRNCSRSKPNRRQRLGSNPKAAPSRSSNPCASGRE